MTVSFKMPDQWAAWKIQPAALIAMIIGHESEGSLLAYVGQLNALRDVRSSQDSSKARN